MLLADPDLAPTLNPIMVVIMNLILTLTLSLALAVLCFEHACITSTHLQLPHHSVGVPYM